MELHGIEWWSWAREAKTQEFVAQLREDVEKIQQDWLMAVFIRDTEHQTMMATAAALAEAQAFSKLIAQIDNIEVEQQEVQSNG